MLSTAHPKEQGLKHTDIRWLMSSTTLSTAHPKEQGLKLLNFTDGMYDAGTFNGTSKRTRIETQNEELRVLNHPYFQRHIQKNKD